MTYFFHPEAEAEHLETVAYYESRRPGIGARYLAEFERVMESVCEAPERNSIAREPEIRRVYLRRFPFAILYRQAAGRIEVLAVAHHRRRPAYWLGRF